MLKEKYGDRVHFILLYVRDAHPGQGQFKGIRQPSTYDERVELAERAQEDLDITSLLLVDEMDNRVGREYGRLPNSAFIIGQDGRVFHKQPWMHSKWIEPPLQALLHLGGRGGDNPPEFSTGGVSARRGRFQETSPITGYKDSPVGIPTGSETEIVWLTKLDRARELARTAGVPLLVEFYFDSCAFCAAMAEGPLRDRGVVDLSRKYVNVKLDRDKKKYADLVEDLELIGSPAFAIYSPKGKVILRHEGYAEADLMRNLLREGLQLSKP